MTSRGLTLVILTAGAALALTGCGSSSESGTEALPTATGPEATDSNSGAPQWWSYGKEPVRADALRQAIVQHGIKNVDLTRARTVAHAGDVDLVALPEANGGYCLAPSTSERTYLGMVCTDGSSGLAPAKESMFLAWAFRSGEAPVWVVLGRITDADASGLSLAGYELDLEPAGFFLVDVPAALGDPPGYSEARLAVVDSSGETIRQADVTLGPSPGTIAPDADSIVTSDVNEFSATPQPSWPSAARDSTGGRPAASHSSQTAR